MEAIGIATKQNKKNHLWYHNSNCIYV